MCNNETNKNTGTTLMINKKEIRICVTQIFKSPLNIYTVTHKKDQNRIQTFYQNPLFIFPTPLYYSLL